jgi:type II secretory pathway pseudopilin PulG
MLLIAVMLIAMAVEVPRIAQQIKREKEEELVHRGKEYALAIKKYYHKVGTYPVSLEQLEDTNHLRFLRQRYKDPMTASGEWKLVHLGEAQINIPVGGAPGAPGSTGTLNSSPLGSAASPSPTPGGFGASSGLSSGLSGGSQTGTQPGAGGQMGTLQTSNIGTGLGGSSQGGGPIIGVASTSKTTSIKEFNGNSEYDQWLFVYDPRLEQAPGSNGVTIASPRSASAPPTGTPAPGTPGAPGTQPAPTPTQGLPR